MQEQKRKEKLKLKKKETMKKKKQLQLPNPFDELLLSQADLITSQSRAAFISAKSKQYDAAKLLEYTS